MGNELVHVVFTVIEVKPFRRKSVKKGMSNFLPTFSSYVQLVDRIYGRYFEKLDERIERRWSHYYRFLDNAKNADTRLKKAMWTNLSKGQRWHALHLQKKRRRHFALIPLSYIAFVTLFVLAIRVAVY